MKNLDKTVEFYQKSYDIWEKLENKYEMERIEEFFEEMKARTQK